jgi:prepilin-type processing-associated H-X9-DG protein
MQPLDYATPIKSPRRPWLVIVLGSVLAVFVALFLGIPRLVIRDPASPRTIDASNLRQIGQGMLIYANNHQGGYPDHIESLLAEGDVGSESLVSPFSSDTAARGPTTQAMIAQLRSGGHFSYVYLGKGQTTSVSAEALLAYGPVIAEGVAPYAGGRNVLFGDGHVEFIDPGLMKWMLAEVAAGRNPPRPKQKASSQE